MKSSSQNTTELTRAADVGDGCESSTCREILYLHQDVQPQPEVLAHSAPEAVSAILLSFSLSPLLPSLFHTITFANSFHRACLKRADTNGQITPSLSGRDISGSPMEGKHEHVHQLPLDLDGDGRLDHLLVWSPIGLEDQIQRAIESMSFLLVREFKLLPRLVARGQRNQILNALTEQARERLSQRLGPESGALVWESVTPFYTPRYLKTKGRNNLEGQIAAECQSRGLPEPSAMEQLSKNHAAHQPFATKRNSHEPKEKGAYALRLHFETPITGPLCLGYGAHYGLGGFAAK